VDAVHARSTRDAETAVADKFVGVVGGIASDAAQVVALAVADCTDAFEAASYALTA
jgi:hypothetical protein